jgi:hypothetical protein
MPRLPTALAMLAIGIIPGCSDGSTDPGGDDGTGNGHVVLTLREQAGTERDMTVRYVVADGPTTRDAASALQPTPFGCFSDIDPVCTIDVPPGQTITFFAIEGEGVVGGDAGNGRPVPPPDVLRHEFVSYVGDCETSAVLGDCTLHVTAARQYNVRAEFAQMKAVVFQMLGAGSLAYSYTVRDRIALPNQPYINTNPGCCAGASVYYPAAPLVYGYLPTGSTVTATRHVVGSGLSQFLQWDKACTAGGGGNLGLTEGGTGDTPPPGCTKIRP